MDPKNEKALDSGCRVVVGLKRKGTAICATSSYHSKVNLWPTCNFPTDMPCKRRKLNGTKGNFECSGYKKSFLRYYSNFMKSGFPARVMFFENGDWVDFPRDLVSSVRQNFQVKNTVVEVKSSGHHVLLDFLHMMGVNLNSGLQHPVAWIDEAGSCFFPESYSFNDGECSSHERSEIRLLLEIDVNAADLSKLKECSGESNDIVKEIQIDQKSDNSRFDADAEDSCNKTTNAKMDNAAGRRQLIGRNLFSQMEPVCDDMDSDSVRNMFFAAMGSCVNADIVNIHHVSSVSMHARLELFQKQVEITEKYRGNANLRYAWIPSSKEAMPSITMYGFGFGELSNSKSTYGIGLHLIPVNYCGISESCDVDENGEQHMVLCRVVLGNMEIVHPGSKQCHPSCADFDSGVDNLQNPRHYVVWQMNMNTCIYPEYAVSFKVPSSAEGSPAQKEGKHDVSGVTTSPGHLQFCSHGTDVGSDCYAVQNSERSLRKDATTGSSTPKVPASPWMPFPILLSAISDKVPIKVMELVHINYDLFKLKRISRDVFIKKLRLAVGDALLRSVITSLQCKVPPMSKSVLKAPKQEPES